MIDKPSKQAKDIMPEVKASIVEAVTVIKNFVKETTGVEPDDEQIAQALKRYFVLKEIKDHIDIDESH